MTYYIREPLGGRGRWDEPCVCGRDIRVQNIPLDRMAWTQQDWVVIAAAVSAHQKTPEHVAWRMGYRVNVLPHTMTPDGLPILGGLE